MLNKIIESLSFLDDLEHDEKVEAINQIREAIHDRSPFKNEPVDFVRWVKNDYIKANDYNPNSVAPPEMELLRVSIMSDGYTQPIVTFNEEKQITVVDGFHRNRVGKECADVKERVCAVIFLSWRLERANPIKATGWLLRSGIIVPEVNTRSRQCQILFWT